MQRLPSEEEDFKFENELREYTEGNMVTSATLKDVVEGVSAKLIVVTLDSLNIEIDWTVERGLLIVEITDADGKQVEKHVGRSFDDLNSLLQNISGGYQKAFASELAAKLANF